MKTKTILTNAGIILGGAAIFVGLIMLESWIGAVLYLGGLTACAIFGMEEEK